ncbi:MAG: hypothetical protein PHO70_02735 [Candidatus Omnitrophica bacterium]|nr:hypothetical protein [Candidatus Omnitrophota bacterium]
MPLKNRSFIYLGQSGCLLPVLILFNLFFGWIFFKPLIWLGIGGILVLLFIINSYILVKKVSNMASAKNKSAIDVEAEIIEDKDRLG